MAFNKSILSATDRSGEAEGGGAWYTSVSLWESAQQSVHVDGDESVLEVYADATVSEDSV